MKPFTKEEVEIKVLATAEDLPIKGSFDSGDEAADRETERLILEDLESGNQWAWASVWVSVHWKGWSAETNLGGCSYKDEAEFLADAYFDDMLNEVLTDLTEQVEEIAKALKERE